MRGFLTYISRFALRARKEFPSYHYAYPSHRVINNLLQKKICGIKKPLAFRQMVFELIQKKI